MYFYKIHPDVVKMSSKEVNDMATKVTDIFGETNKDVIGHYESLREKFIKTYNKNLGSRSEKGEYFDRAYLSNLLYDKAAYGIGDQVLASYSGVDRVPVRDLSQIQFDKLADKGKIRQATGKDTPQEKGLAEDIKKGLIDFNYYSKGKAAGYSDADIAAFYKSKEAGVGVYQNSPEGALYWFNIDKKAHQRYLDNKAGMKDDGFFRWIRDYSAIQNAKGFNKRNQIWLTDGFALDVDYFNKRYKEKGGTGTEDGKAKFRIFKDADNKNLTKDDRAALYTEATDGAILVEENFVDALNATYGLPQSGQNKSFIVDSDPTHGALLGKFMFHKASKKASEWMRKEGLHMLMPESAVKETGSRIFGDLKVNDKGEGEYTRGTKLPDIKIVRTKKDIISKNTGRIVGAQTDYKNKSMLINEDQIKKDFKNKAWTKPKVKGVIPLAEDAIKTPQELVDFYIAHEKAHFTPENQAIPRGPLRENHANQLALTELGTQVYDLNLVNIKGSLSEKQTPHMMERQLIPKQLMANIVHHSKNKISRDVINDYFDDIIGKNYRGDAELNTALEEALALPKKEFTEAKQEKILKDFHKYGIREVIDALRNNTHHDFVSRLYQKVLKSNTQVMHQDYESGEITQREYLDLVAEAKHYTSNINRMMQIYPDVAVFMHKDVRNYLQAALRNFVVNSVVRPKWDYSVSVRMRGLDPWLAKEFDFMDLNTAGKGSVENKKRLKEEYGVENADELFLLDDKYRDVEYTMPEDVLPRRKKKYTLGELWDEYMSTPELRKKTNRDNPNLVEWFKTVSLRVPMDSISGAHKLTFAGFTGIDGHGAIFHPRTMRALGGADLDGDKAFVLFGMKPEYKNMYHDNKYEYLAGKGTADNKSAPVSEKGMAIIREFLGKSDHDQFIRDAIDKNNLTYRDLLTTTTSGDQAELALKDSPIGKYTVQSRMDISRGASEGRFQLGPAVSQKQILNAAYDAMVNSPAQRYFDKKGNELSVLEYNALTDSQKQYWTPDKREKLTINIKDFDTGVETPYEIYVLPRTGEDSIAYSRELMRAQIGFGSDPLDEIALTGSADWFNKAWHSLFKVDWNGNEGIKKQFAPNMHARQGLVDTFTGFNQAYFSRNWKENRRWYAHEILERAEKIGNLTQEQRNTMLPKMVELIKPIKYTDDILRRVKTSDRHLERLYDEYSKDTEVDLFKLNRELGKELGKGKGGLFDRLTFKVKFNPEIKRAIELDLQDPERRLYYTKEENFAKLFNRKQDAQMVKDLTPITQGKVKGKKATLAELLAAEREARGKRAEAVDNYYRDHSFYLQSDLMDFASGKQILKAYEIAKSEGLSTKLFDNMITFVESVKSLKEINLKRKLKKQ